MVKSSVIGLHNTMISKVLLFSLLVSYAVAKPAKIGYDLEEPHKGYHDKPPTEDCVGDNCPQLLFEHGLVAEDSTSLGTDLPEDETIEPTDATGSEAATDSTADVRALPIESVSDTIVNGNSGISLPGTFEGAPEITAEVTLEVTEEADPELTEEVVVEVGEDIVPEVTGEVAPEIVDEIVPVVVEEVAPVIEEEVAPEIVEEPTAEEIVPETADEIVPEVTEGVSPAIIDETGLVTEVVDIPEDDAVIVEAAPVEEIIPEVSVRTGAQTGPTLEEEKVIAAVISDVDNEISVPEEADVPVEETPQEPEIPQEFNGYLPPF